MPSGLVWLHRHSRFYLCLVGPLAESAKKPGLYTLNFLRLCPRTAFTGHFSDRSIRRWIEKRFLCPTRRKMGHFADVVYQLLTCFFRLVECCYNAHWSTGIGLLYCTQQRCDRLFGAAVQLKTFSTELSMGWVDPWVGLGPL